MKIKSSIAVIMLMMISVMFFTVRADASELGTDSVKTEEAAYRIGCSEDGYELYRLVGEGEESALISGALTEIISFIQNEAYAADIFFEDVTCTQRILFSSGAYSIRGRIDFDGGAMVIDGSAVTLSEAELYFIGGGIRIKRGSLSILDGVIESIGTAVTMDYSSSAELNIKGGRIYSASDKAAVSVEYGTCRLSGGRIENSVGCAVLNSSSLILLGNSELCGVDYDVISTAPVTLSEGGKKLVGSARIKFAREFEKGKIGIIAYGASVENEKAIKLYDRNGTLINVKYFDSFCDGCEEKFLSAYIPYEIKFVYDEGSFTDYRLSGEKATAPEIMERSGYTFLGWRVGSAEGDFYEFSENICSDVVLYPAYKLTAPSFSFSSLSFTYDGRAHSLSLTDLYHPLLNEGVMSYRWYKDGNEIGSFAEKIDVKNVADSGKYKCSFVFAHKTHTVTVTTPEISVSILKCRLEPPKIPSVYYNGEVRYPDIHSISLYEVERIGRTDAGIYPIKVRLTDPENYAFVSSSENEITVDFEIKRAENYWVEELSVCDIYDWEEIDFYAKAAFGDAVLLFSEEKDGEFSAEPPRRAGVYYVMARINATENYSELSTDALRFVITVDSVESIYFISQAKKCEYCAFEEFSVDGLSLGARYMSGVEKEISIEKINLKYHTGTHFLFGDSSLILEYEGKTLLHPVKISKAAYDVSGIIFSDSLVEYNGEYQTPSYKGEAVMGVDGSLPKIEIIGGATASGSYSVILRFVSESANYETPDELYATMVIMPKEVDVIWQDLVFVYDGTRKLPRAHYIDVFGRKVILNVSGARSYAGTYTASVSLTDSNYKAKNSSVEFTVNRADYDLSNAAWTGTDLVYNGKEQSVFLSGLPEGVSVIGYSDNRALDAGTYYASVIFSYDENNYNKPEIEPYKWVISPARYDESLIAFSDKTYTYDGEEHFPEFVGTLPTGIDGSSPTYSFSKGATNVSDGKLTVFITFSTESKNYLAPKEREATVEILPKGINVIWSGEKTVYSAEPYTPTANATECKIAITGAQTDVGKYTASAKALDTNYRVLNAEYDFEILKAENYWKCEPKIEDIYASGELLPIGECAFGESLFLFSENKEDEIITPKLPGIYYFKVIGRGDKNHLDIESDWLEFEIVAVVAVSLEVNLIKTEYLALDKITDRDLTLCVKNNDSGIIEVPFSDISVSYESGECFSSGDSWVNFSYLGFNVRKEVTVNKRSYDTSSVFWDGTNTVYDGSAKQVVLCGLPLGVEVIEYIGNGQTSAGIYTVSARLSYDTVNYNEPTVADAVLIIEKQPISLPEIESAEYTSELIIPKIADSLLYSYEFEGGILPGTYNITFTLTDNANYTFEGAEDEKTLTFEIKKRAITVKISDMEIYLFGKMSEPRFEITAGSLLESDVLVPVYHIGEEELSASFDAEYYDIEVINGKIHRYGYLSAEDTGKALLILALIIIGIVITLILILKRKRFAAFYVRVFSKGERFIPQMPIESELKEPAITYSEEDKVYEPPKADLPSDSDTDESESQEDGKETESDESDITDPTVIDAEYADNTISDSLAKDLIRKDIEIVTDGNRKRIINVDTLSRSFSSGARVDINLLKKKSLIPYDTGYIKVLARGIIDKPLEVYANDFSLSAVKMIALAGGKSVKVNKAPKIKLSTKGNFGKGLEKNLGK